MKNILLIITLFLSHFLSISQEDNLKADEATEKIMIMAKQNADNYLKLFFGDTIFKTNLKWNVNNSRIDTKNNHTYTNYLDSISFKPDFYQLSYNVYDNETHIGYFLIEADSLGLVKEVPINHYLYDDLNGYKLLLNRTFKVSKFMALEIGKKHEIKGDNLYAELNNNRNEVLSEDYKGEKVISYYWEVSIKNCEKCKMIHIDPMTGKIISKMMVEKTTRY